MERIPAYLKVYDILKRQIVEREYGVGDLLPAEPVLEKKFKVSRTTVRKAVDMLSREGFVIKKQGIGTEILDHKTMQNLNYVTSISETLQKKGYTVTTKCLRVEVMEASAHLASDLRIKSGEKVVCIQRIKFADGKAIAIMKNFLVADMVEGIEKRNEDFNLLYRFLEENYNISIDAARDTITAKSANSVEAEMLDVPVGCALLAMRRIGYGQGKPICVDELSIVGDRYEFVINMNGRDSR
jgi:GntR family transcriptional regulator